MQATACLSRSPANVTQGAPDGLGSIPWPAGPRLMLLVGEDECPFPGICVGFPRQGLARLVLHDDAPSVPKDPNVDWYDWLAACGRALEEREHHLVHWQSTDDLFFRKWVTSLRGYARYSFKPPHGVYWHDMGMGHAAYDVGPYSGMRRWPTDGAPS